MKFPQQSFQSPVTLNTFIVHFSQSVQVSIIILFPPKETRTRLLHCQSSSLTEEVILIVVKRFQGEIIKLMFTLCIRHIIP